MTIEKLCVFCGSSGGKDPAFVEVAQQLGCLLAERSIELVYGGGNVGLMGALADAVLGAGGEVTGVIPDFLVRKEVAHQGLTKLEVVDSMHTRKLRMNELTDGFIALPGGFGTFEELFETVTWSQLGLHKKPIGILNINGFYDHLEQFVNHTITQGFVKESQRTLLQWSDRSDDLLDKLESWQPEGTERWISSGRAT